MRKCRIISIHSPDKGRDSFCHMNHNILYQFQSTLPTRGETQRNTMLQLIKQFQSTLPTRGETQYASNLLDVDVISIHSPDKGRDMYDSAEYRKAFMISIHSPDKGRDFVMLKIKNNVINFNPLSRQGERRDVTKQDIMKFKFQSTLPTRGETTDRLGRTFGNIFQSTLPTRGETRFFYSSVQIMCYFNPLSRQGERLLQLF